MWKEVTTREISGKYCTCRAFHTRVTYKRKYIPFVETNAMHRQKRISKMLYTRSTCVPRGLSFLHSADRDKVSSSEWVVYRFSVATKKSRIQLQCPLVPCWIKCIKKEREKKRDFEWDKIYYSILVGKYFEKNVRFSSNLSRKKYILNYLYKVILKGNY